MAPLPIPLSFLFPLCFFFLIVQGSSVPSNARFKYVIAKLISLGGSDVEYDAQFRVLHKFLKAPVMLSFYNTTADAFTLAASLGGWGSGEKRWTALRWIWEANRGNPVSEKGSLTFGRDANLVLAEADGKIAWQTNTANKGVEGMKLLSNGNLVLHNSKGKFIWQSFEHPTDTIMVGQPLRLGKKLVSRASRQNNSDGAYSLVVETQGMAMYYKSPESANLLLYYKQLFNSSHTSVMDYITIYSEPPSHDFDSQLGLDIHDSDRPTGGLFTLSLPKFNNTLTFLRLGMDGNARFYTYYDKVLFPTWEITYTFFSKESSFDEPSIGHYYIDSKCQLPEKCGEFGLCENNQCVACPISAGLMGWSEDCAPLKPACKDFHYYKLQGVDHFLTKYTDGEWPMKKGTCLMKCSQDCKCMGYFYHSDTSIC